MYASQLGSSDVEGEVQYRGGQRLRKEGGEATRRPKCTSAYLHMMIDRSTYLPTSCYLLLFIKGS